MREVADCNPNEPALRASNDSVPRGSNSVLPSASAAAARRIRRRQVDSEESRVHPMRGSLRTRAASISLPLFPNARRLVHPINPAFALTSQAPTDPTPTSKDDDDSTRNPRSLRGNRAPKAEDLPRLPSRCEEHGRPGEGPRVTPWPRKHRRRQG